MNNAEIALHFDELGDLYELDGAIIHRVVAYRNAAKAIREASASVEELTRAGQVTQLAGVGKTIEEIRAAAEAEQIRDLRGFGAKAEESILAALAAGEDGRPKPRLLLSKALAIAEALASALREHPACEQV